MARIEGVDLPRNKRVEIGLTYIFGIGKTRSRQDTCCDGCKSRYPCSGPHRS